MMSQIEVSEIQQELELTDIPNFARMRDVQDFAPNMEVQAEEIRDIFYEIPELSFENWQNLDMDRRADVLNQFEEKIAAIEMRTSLPVAHEAMPAGRYGYCDGQKLVLSDSQLASNTYDDYREVLDTLFHEGRHAYQFYNLGVQRTEQSDELLQSWDSNLNKLGYQNAASVGFYRYYTQPVEVDARLFAETVIKKIGI